MPPELPTILIIPTGIGCSVGGFAGDAIPAARALAAASGCLITHPNVMNGASLFWNDSRIHYVEGYGLDRFAIGEVLLRPVRQQKIGLLLDAGIESELRERHLHVAQACKATLGLNIGPIEMTEIPIEINLNLGSSGSSWGSLLTPEVLLKAGENLKSAGATAIAIVTRFPDDSAELQAYRQGEGVDALAGAEAVISHLLVRNLCIPCAHAPAVSGLPLEPFLDSRAAAEELGHTFLPCVFVGLSRAPDLLLVKKEYSLEDFSGQRLLHIDQVGAVVVPQGALGGEAILSCIERGKPVILVENPSVLNVTSTALGINQSLLDNNANVINACNYVEAAGLITLLREGISLDSLYRPISGI